MDHARCNRECRLQQITLAHCILYEPALLIRDHFPIAADWISAACWKGLPQARHAVG